MEQPLLLSELSDGACLGGNMGSVIRKSAKAVAILSILAFSSASFANLGNAFDPSKVSNVAPVSDTDYSRLMQVAQAVNAEMAPSPRLQLKPNANVSGRRALQDLQMIYEQVIPPTGSNIWNCTAPACTGQ